MRFYFNTLCIILLLYSCNDKKTSKQTEEAEILGNTTIVFTDTDLDSFKWKEFELTGQQKIIEDGFDGYKDLLGMYISKSEGANFWLSCLSDIQSRGVQDILIACTDT